MEFNEKLQELRNQKGITQEELAQALYVSRTAISKWESGRGYPNIDSLKAIAIFFEITIDQLLSGNQLLTIAQEDTKRKEKYFRDKVFGLLDLSIAMLLFLPFFGQKVSESAQSFSLLSLNSVSPYLKTAYFIIVFAIILFGVLTLTLQNCKQSFWVMSKNIISLVLNGMGAVLFVISLQPYAAIFLLVILAIKVLIIMKK